MHGIKQTPDDATFSSINARNKKITTFSFRQDFPLSQKVRLQYNSLFYDSEFSKALTFKN